MKNNSSPDRSGLFQFLSKVFEWSGVAGLFVAELKDSVRTQIDLFLRRVEYRFVIYLWLSIGLLFLIVGFFDLLMDWIKVSRGAVYSIGGLVIFLVALVLLQNTKIQKTKK